MPLQELQEMVGEISPDEKNILEQVKLKRFSDYRSPDELKNEATRLGKFAPENILRDGLTGLLNYYSKEYIKKTFAISLCHCLRKRSMGQKLWSTDLAETWHRSLEC